MINKILLIIGIILTIVPYLILLITYISNRKKTNITTSDNIIKILKNDNKISFIESKDSFFSYYNIKRKIIKLSKETYDSNTYFHVALSSLLVGYSLINNNIINYLSYIINKLRIISIMPIISIILSIYASNIADSKIALIIIIIIAIIQYILNALTEIAVNNVKKNNTKINNILDTFLLTTKIYFIATLVQILRLVIIIIKI